MKPEATSRHHDMHDFLARSGWGDAELSPLAGDASFRRYIRVRAGERKAMLMDAPPQKEDVRPYIAVAKLIRGLGCSAPNILAEDARQGFLLCEDLGDDLFTRVLAGQTAIQGVSEQELYNAAIDLLIEWSAHPGARRGGTGAYLGDYDEAVYLREVSLFADWYLPEAIGVDKAQRQRQEYMDIWQGILREARLPCELLVHRDFHADNLLWLPQRSGVQRIGLLDFQDALWGHGAYDLVSLLEDARRDVAEETVHAALSRYISGARVDEKAFMTAYCLLGAQRNSKIIGIFVRLARRDNKHAYLQFLPRVWKHLERDLSHPLLKPLATWLDAHISPALRGAIRVEA